MPRGKPTRSNSAANTAKPVNGEAASQTPQTMRSGNLDEAVRIRAYQLYVERGFQDGFAQEDWLRAEAELNSSPERRH